MSIDGNMHPTTRSEDIAHFQELLIVVPDPQPSWKSDKKNRLRTVSFIRLGPGPLKSPKVEDLRKMRRANSYLNMPRMNNYESFGGQMSFFILS